MAEISFENLAQYYSTEEENTLELEARFGRWSGSNFKSQVPAVYYERLLHLFGSTMTTSISTVDVQTLNSNTNLRRLTTIVPNGNDIVFEEKTKLEVNNYRAYGLRVALNREKTVAARAITPEITRNRTRNSVVVYRDFTLDLTEVTSKQQNLKTGKNELVIELQVELEYKGAYDVAVLARFREAILSIWRLMRDTNYLYTEDVRLSLVRDINKVLGSDDKYNISKDSLVQARNLNVRDIVYGGLVGNETIGPYNVTYKADGLRKLFIIHTTGLWLVYPPYEYNLLLTTAESPPNVKNIIKIMNRTVLDGEIVPRVEYTAELSARLISELVTDGMLVPIVFKNSSYLAFDCLYYPNRAALIIRDQPYATRIKGIEVLVGKIPLLPIKVKRTELLDNPETFFTIIASMLDNLPDTAVDGYPTDGLIFTPVKQPYNLKSSTLPLHDRSLVTVPDICKWKPVKDMTIDFKYVSRGPMLPPLLLVYDAARHKEVSFTGSKRYPFVISKETVITNDLTANLNNETIVEYEWQLKADNLPRKVANIVLVPRLIRRDKNTANKLDIAEDNWNHILEPITPADLTGKTLKFVFAYHNRIKRALFDTLAPGANLLDIGSGRGGDVNKWKNLGIILAIEPDDSKDSSDPTGLSKLDELERRIVANGLAGRVQILQVGGENTVEIDAAIADIIPEGVDAVALMLSMSFFWRSPAYIKALVHTITVSVKPGATIIFLTINGQRVLKLFEKFGTREVRLANANLKLLPLDEFGRQPLYIDIPDTIVTKQVEYLVNLDDFSRELAEQHFELYTLEDAIQEQLLSADAKIFSALYSYGIYRQTGEPLQPKYPGNVPLEEEPVEKPVVELTPPTYAKANVSIADNKVLPSLAVTWTTSISYADGVAKGDDVIAPLTCTWYTNIFRVATIGNGDCFFHAVLKAVYSKYRVNKGVSSRLGFASSFRKQLSELVLQPDPKYPGHSRWQTARNGIFPRLLMQELADEAIITALKVDYSPEGISRLFNSHAYVGDEVVGFVADILGIDIYIVRADGNDVYGHLSTKQLGSKQDAIIIMGNQSHYEPVVIQEPAYTIIFKADSPIITALDKKIRPTEVQDIAPDTIFVNDLLDNFGSIDNIPLDKIKDRFANSLGVDPFTSTLYRVLGLTPN